MKRRLGALVGACMLACGTSALAADEFMYIVNATGRPLAIGIDGPGPEAAHLMAVTRRVSVGKHLLITAGASGSAATTVELTTAAAIRDGQQRTFWCFIVGQPAEGPPKVIEAKPEICAELIQRGVGDRALK